MTKNRIVMKRTSLLSLIVISVFCTFTLGSADFHLISLFKTYQEAKSYCREMYTDLATLHNSVAMNNLISLVSNTATRAWIGLEAGNVSMWHWSLYDQKTDFFNWKSGQPQNNNRNGCVVMDQHGKWFESDCGIRRSFVCQDNGETSSRIFVADTKSWRNAQSHCRGLSSDLASIHSAEENEAVQSVSASQNVWIGLFKDPWMWSDGSNSSFRFWKPSQPNYLEDQDCVAAVFRDGGLWNDLKCGGKRRFVCQGARKLIPTTATIETTAKANSTNDPKTLTTLLKTTAEDVKPDFTRTKTEQPITTDVPTASTTTESSISITADFSTISEVASTTETSISTTTGVSTTSEAVTTTETTILTTTDFERYTSDNSTTEMPNITATRPTSSVNVTRDIERMFTRSENIILIQENMTWIEALSYCREHHIDLVHITSEDIQDKVAEKAKNSTSSHIWLGLRYTCNFKFWFWIRSTPACYQNWQPGQGAYREYDCGVSGAMEATGRQQWVGLPETERLNFICSTCAG